MRRAVLGRPSQHVPGLTRSRTTRSSPIRSAPRTLSRASPCSARESMRRAVLGRPSQHVPGLAHSRTARSSPIRSAPRTLSRASPCSARESMRRAVLGRPSQHVPGLTRSRTTRSLPIRSAPRPRLPCPVCRSCRAVPGHLSQHVPGLARSRAARLCAGRLSASHLGPSAAPSAPGVLLMAVLRPAVCLGTPLPAAVLGAACLSFRASPPQSRLPCSARGSMRSAVLGRPSQRLLELTRSRAACSLPAPPRFDRGSHDRCAAYGRAVPGRLSRHVPGLARSRAVRGSPVRFASWTLRRGSRHPVCRSTNCAASGPRASRGFLSLFAAVPSSPASSALWTPSRASHAGAWVRTARCAWPWLVCRSVAVCAWLAVISSCRAERCAWSGLLS
ncbi:hypothetical protein ACRB68_10480 [Actinomadura sp. RB68]|uniref:Uncharacterized protein n=1 Tax=Actinomadura macrotermitis TaxID=2585200 RepID=A0A7K0BPD1_9ACTN|nr:hypothetical protein [Actinomadura macrotermitis]